MLKISECRQSQHLWFKCSLDYSYIYFPSMRHGCYSSTIHVHLICVEPCCILLHTLLPLHTYNTSDISLLVMQKFAACKTPESLPLLSRQCPTIVVMIDLVASGCFFVQRQWSIRGSCRPAERWRYPSSHSSRLIQACI